MFEDLSSGSVLRLREYLKEGAAYLQEIADRKESLKDLTKAIAEELGVKPAELSKALNAEFKNSIEDLKESMSVVESLLDAAHGTAS